MIPTSLRLIQISGIGLVLAVAIPLALLFAIVRLDPRIKSPTQIERLVKIPLLVTIPYAATSSDRSQDRNRTLLAMVMVGGVFAIYVGVFLIKLRFSS